MNGRFIAEAVSPNGRTCDMVALAAAGPGAIAFGLLDDTHAWEFHVCTRGVAGGPLPTFRWHVDSTAPLTVSPSIHCVRAQGGCGLHGWIREGRWVTA